MEAPKLPAEADRKNLKTMLPLVHVRHLTSEISVSGKKSNVQLEIERWPISSTTPIWKSYSDSLAQKWHTFPAAAATVVADVKPESKRLAAAAASKAKTDSNGKKKKPKKPSVAAAKQSALPIKLTGTMAVESNVLLKPFRVHHKLLSQVSRIEWQIYEQQPIRCVLYQGMGNDERIVAVIRA